MWGTIRHNNLGSCRCDLSNPLTVRKIMYATDVTEWFSIFSHVNVCPVCYADLWASLYFCLDLRRNPLKGKVKVRWLERVDEQTREYKAVSRKRTLCENAWKWASFCCRHPLHERRIPRTRRQLNKQIAVILLAQLNRRTGQHKHPICLVKVGNFIACVCIMFCYI